MNDPVLEKIIQLKNQLSNKVIIPVHHYQNQAVSSIADFLGDSYKLAVDCSKSDAEYIVFCGVLFMAESADILKKPFQKVIIPANNADCPMANMADLTSVNEIFNKITALAGNNIVPIVYMNSYADLKAFCGQHGGSVCTSSNAHVIMNHYLKQGKKVLFFPDANLGMNTAFKLRLNHKNMILTKKLDNYNDEQVILWDGYCPIHKRFTPGDISVLKSNYPGIKVIVHPECPEEITAQADAIGSTEFILNTINDSPEGSIWGVGTETIFVDKLSADNLDKTIVPLKVSECINMKKTTTELVLKSLINITEHIASNGTIPLMNVISVPEIYKKDAATALNKMIAIVTGELQ